MVRAEGVEPSPGLPPQDFKSWNGRRTLTGNALFLRDFAPSLGAGLSGVSRKPWPACCTIRRPPVPLLLAKPLAVQRRLSRTG